MTFELESTPKRRARRPSMVDVRRSPIQGLGVFATRDIPKGARIIEYTGERITEDEALELYDDEKSAHHHTFLFNIDGNMLIDATDGGNESRFINHSCEPNCRAVLERGRIYFHARRNIGAGEELAYDYWYTTDEEYSDADLRRIYPCTCRAKTCRGTLAAPRDGAPVRGEPVRKRKRSRG